jgi:hypothetical protein
MQAAFLKLQAGAFQLVGDELFVRQDRLILGCEDFIGEIVWGVVSF